MAWRSAFEWLPRVRNLEIIFNTTSWGRRRVPEDISADFSLEIVTALFGTQATDTRKRLTLRSLQVMGLDLTKAAQLLCQAVDHTQLLALGLQQCKNTTAMLHALNPKTRVGGLKLRSLVLTGALRSEIFNDVLCSFDTLEYLVVRIPEKVEFRPDFKCLLPHATTLRFLYLDYAKLITRNSSERTFQIHLDTKTTFSDCVKLEQLAIRPHFAPWQLLDVLGQDIWYALKALPALRSLRFLNYAEDPDTHWPEVITLLDLPSHTTNVFTEVPKLRALSLGTAAEDPWIDGDDEFHPPYYTRGCLIDTCGREQTMALERELEDMVDYEPCSEILSLDIKPSQLLRYGYKP
ncbi:hypothetical protein LTR08_008823 [Meristemomyces frigidus]|nr:hypothetical protein LTR08_008823 [Meristemomyces frigidus]